MRFSPLRHVSVLMLLMLFFAQAAAQDEPELTGTAEFSEDIYTLSISHPEDWVTFSDEAALYLASDEDTLDVSVAQSGTLARRSTGVVIYAPSTAATLDLPDDASAGDALTAFLESQTWQSPSGEVYDGDPAVSFNMFPLQADGNIDFGTQLITDASVDAYAFEREETFIFVLLISNSDVFALSEAMWESLTLEATGDASTETETTRAAGDFVLAVEDEGREYAFSATLSEGWESAFDEETGTVILASSSAALDVATGEGDEYERGDSALIITLPPGLRLLDINPFDSADLVFTAYAATLEIEAYPSFVEGFEVFTAQGYIAGEALPGGQANLYAFGFPAGVVTVIVQDVLGASNPDASDVLRSIRYDLPE